MDNTIGCGGIQEATAELAIADWLTEELPVAAARPGPPLLRCRSRLWVAAPALLMLVIGLVAGIALALNARGAAHTSAAPRVTTDPSPSSAAAATPASTAPTTPSARATVASPSAVARPSAAAQPAVVTPSAQAAVSAPVPVVLPDRAGNGVGAGVGSRTFSGGLSPGSSRSGGGFGEIR